MNLEKYMADLRQNSAQVTELVSGLPQEYLLTAPEGKWNILQILEHVLIVERGVIVLLMRPAKETTDKAEIQGAERLRRILVGMRNRKIDAPAFFHPKGEIQSVEEFEKIFLTQRNKLTDGLRNGSIKIDDRLHHHMILGAMSISDWLEFVPLHTQRHLEQIKDLLAERNRN